jgi:hypothetical protein
MFIHAEPDGASVAMRRSSARATLLAPITIIAAAAATLTQDFIRIAFMAGTLFSFVMF